MGIERGMLVGFLLQLCSSTLSVQCFNFCSIEIKSIVPGFTFSCGFMVLLNRSIGTSLQMKLYSCNVRDSPREQLLLQRETKERFVSWFSMTIDLCYSIGLSFENSQSWNEKLNWSTEALSPQGSQHIVSNSFKPTWVGVRHILPF